METRPLKGSIVVGSGQRQPMNKETNFRWRYLKPARKIEQTRVLKSDCGKGAALDLGGTQAGLSDK